MRQALPFLVLTLACGAGSIELQEISQDALLAEPDTTLILDVRSAGEFASGHVPNAVNIPHDELSERLGEIEGFRDSSVVLYCERGGRAGKAGTVLADAGFSQLHHLTGDMSAWREGGLPTESPE